MLHNHKGICFWCILLLLVFFLGNVTVFTSTFQEIQAQAAQNKKAKGKNQLRFYDEQSKAWYTMKVKNQVKKHDYDWSHLINKKNKIQYKDDNYVIRKGIDVSHHQGKINWKKVKKDGVEFAFIRIGFRGYGQSGGLHLDEQFQRNIKKAEKAGLDVGVYFFSQAINKKEALEEAELVIKTLKGKKLKLPVVYDPERILGVSARTDGLSKKQLTKNTIAFCEKVKEAGYEAMFYSNLYSEAFLFQLTKLAEYPIWYADYEKIPQTPYAFSFWQYSSTGKIEGISGRVDLDIQFLPRQ